MRSLALPCVLLIACISGSCGQSDLLVFFKVTGQTASIKSLGITLRLDGKLSKEGDFVITESLDRFAVQLPPSAAGLLTATVSGRDGVGAVIAGDTSARAEIAADARSVELEVSLHALHSCSTDGWCPYSSPLLTAPTDLKAIWSHDHADVWVGGVSKAGSMLHWNGQYWSQHELNTPASILSIWGSDSDDIYAANTDGPMLHWDGNSWRPVQSTTTMNMSTIWGSGPNDIWSASTTKDIVHGDGSTWQRVTSDTGLSTVNGIWGSDAEHVWIVVSNQDETKGGVLFCTQSANHCDDFTASMVPSPKGLTGIWGSDDNDIWAIAQDGFWHYDGKWTFTQADPGVRPLHISGSDSADIWAVGENMTSHWDGKIWQHVPIEGSLLNVAVSRKRDVWAVGRLGLILHRKDNRWYRTPENYVTPSLFTNIRRLWGPAANNIWAVGSHALLHWNGFSWSSFSDISISLNSIRGIDADHIWAVGDAGIIMSWQKDRWLVDTSLSISVNLNDVLVTETTAWAVGDSGTVLRYEDGKWTENQTGLPKKNLTTIWGTGATDIWVAGDGIVAHYTDAWKLVTFNQPLPSDLPIRSLWGERLGQNTRLWIVGANRNGAAPNNNIYACSTATMMCSQPASASSITANWTHVWGRSDLGVYAVSDRGDIWHAYKDGGTLERSDTRLPLYGIWASNMADIWAVGADGTILHAQK